MQGSMDQMQLNLISRMRGSITPEVWRNVVKLNLYDKIELLKNQKRQVLDFKNLDIKYLNILLNIWFIPLVIERLKPYMQNQYACDLLDQLLVLDPHKRINADRALDHDFFWTDPMPTDLRRMLSQQHESMFELHTKRYDGQQHYQQCNAAEVEYSDRIY